MAEKKKTIYRDSGTGRIITEQAAKRDPDGTEKQRVPVRTTKPTKKGS